MRLVPDRWSMGKRPNIAVMALLATSLLTTNLPATELPATNLLKPDPFLYARGVLLLPAGRSGPSGGCLAWSIDGLRLGMRVQDAREFYPDLKRNPKYDGIGIGPARYFWNTNGNPRRRNYIIADGDSESSRVVSYAIDMNGDGATAVSARSRLTERWGVATEPAGIERYLVVAEWSNPACDAEAQLQSIVSVESGEKKIKLLLIVRSSTAQSVFENRKERERRQREREQPW